MSVTPPKSTGSKASNLVQRELSKASHLIQEDATSLSTFAYQGVSSGAWLYPLQGILYLFSHSVLFQEVKPIIVRSAIMSAIVVAAMFVFTYLPQVAVLALVTGPLAFIAAVPLILTESLFLINLINKSFITPGASAKLFDAILVQKGYSELVGKGRSITKSGKGVQILGKSLLRDVGGKFTTEGLIRYFLSIPLNAIPGIGTAFFLFYNGQHTGPGYHSRYFTLKGWNSQQRDAFVHKNQGAYTANVPPSLPPFGALSLSLGLVPIIGTLFAFTNTVGAALWAADLEKKQGGGGISEGKEEVKVGMGSGEL